MVVALGLWYLLCSPHRSAIQIHQAALWHGMRKDQIPPDLVVKSQAIDIAEVILSRIRRPHVVHTLCRPRKSRCELLSTSEAHWFTTKSECAVKAQGRNVARPESMQVLSEPLELSSADHSAG